MRLTGVLAGLLVVAGCVGPSDAPDGVDLVAHRVLTADHLSDAALRVAFLPRPERCSPQDLIATRALSRLAEEREDVAVLTVIPAGLPAETGMDGLPFPGHVVDLPLHALEEVGRKVERPRLEVYGRDGRLLLLRPVNPWEEERLLVQEVLGLLRYTPMDG